MSEFISNLVKSMTAVREQYQQELENVPQYAAFLQVKQSTQKAADALGQAGGAGGMADLIIATLHSAQSQFKEHLATLPEYRAMLAMDKYIANLSPAEATSEPEKPAAASMDRDVDYGEKVERALAEDAPGADEQPMTAEAASNETHSDQAVAESAVPVAADEPAAAVGHTEADPVDAVAEQAPGEAVGEHASGEAVAEQAAGEAVAEQAPGEAVAEQAAGEAVAEQTSVEQDQPPAAEVASAEPIASDPMASDLVASDTVASEPLASDEPATAETATEVDAPSVAVAEAPADSEIVATSPDAAPVTAEAGDHAFDTPMPAVAAHEDAERAA
jgi:hypothetical protein